MLLRFILLLFVFWIFPAFSWYFPEHALITEKGLMTAPLTVKKVLSEKYKELVENETNLELCPNIDAPFFDITKITQDKCIPYNTLPALASDHSSFPEELKNHLITKNGNSLGGRIVQGAQDHWKEVLALDIKNISEAKRRSLIRKLDIFLTMVDSDYINRAENHSSHFAPADEIYSKVIKDLVQDGRIDNLLNQFIVHHLRSLQFARLSNQKGKNQNLYRWIAFLEHAFALHFLQDGFASGHIVMFAPYLTPESNFNRIMRHDYFNRNGLDVSRSKSPLSCSYFRLMGESSIPGIEDPKSVCWTTFGDGFLNKTDGLDFKWAANAVTKMETLFAIALDSNEFKKLLLPDLCLNQKSMDLDEIFSFINPYQPWMIRETNLRLRKWECFDKQFILKKTIDSISYLEKTPQIKEINANTNHPLPSESISKIQVGEPLEECVDSVKEKVDKDSVEKTSKFCPSNKAVNLGKPDVNLLSGIISSMPITQADKKELFGSDPFSSNLSSQLSIGFPILANFISEESVYFGFNFQFGISYRLEHVIADNPNFGAAELLVGIYNAGQIGRGDPNPVTVANFEFRSALPNFGLDYLFNKFYFGLFKEGKPKYNDIVGQFDFTYSFIDGFRYYTQLLQRTGQPSLRAWDIEVFTINLPLNDEIRGLERISRIPSQIRLRMGKDVSSKSFMIGLEFAVGFSRSF